MLLTLFADKIVKVNLLVIIAVTLVHSTIGDNILLLCNQGVSHCNEMSRIGQGLIERGHSLFIILQDRMDEWYKQSVRDRNISILENKVGDGVPVLASDESTKNMMELALTLTFREQYLACGNIFSAICNAMLEDEDLARQVVDANITFAVVDCFYMYPRLPILAHHYDLPFVCRVTSLEAYTARVPFLPSFSPGLDTFYSDKMSFRQRLENIYQGIYTLIYDVPGRDIPQTWAMLEKYAPGYASLQELIRKALMFIQTRDHNIDFALPTMPHTITVPGIS